jgi:predicted metal-binding protein
MTAHVTVHELPGRIVAVYCGHCAGTLRLALPVPVAELLDASQAFATRHAACKAQDRPSGPF